MGTLRRGAGKWQSMIRIAGHPQLIKTFDKHEDAIRYKKEQFKKNPQTRGAYHQLKWHRFWSASDFRRKDKSSNLRKFRSCLTGPITLVRLTLNNSEVTSSNCNWRSHSSVFHKLFRVFLVASRLTPITCLDVTEYFFGVTLACYLIPPLISGCLVMELFFYFKCILKKILPKFLNLLLILFGLLRLFFH